METLEQSIIEKVKKLKHDEQSKVLHFINSIEDGKGLPKKGLKGIWADLNIEISDDKCF